MNFFKRWLSRLRVLAGVLLLLAGSVVAYFWLYRMAPARRLADPEWVKMHSEAARWAEEQKDYRRTGRSPDVFFRGDAIGSFGNKEWFLWVEEKIRDDDHFRFCGCTESVLTMMVNQHPKSWPEWTATNRHKTQEQWIQDGFKAVGIDASIPAKEEEILPLLSLMGHTSWDVLMGGRQGTNEPAAVPSYLKYNAYRWLRDSGFQLHSYLSTNEYLLTNTNLVVASLNYARWSAGYSGAGGLGRLSFAEYDDGSGMSAYVNRPPVKRAVNGAIAFCFVAGPLSLMPWGRFRRSRGS